MAETQSHFRETDRTSSQDTAGVEAAAAVSMLSEVFRTIRDRNSTVSAPESQQAGRNPCDTPPTHALAEPTSGTIDLPSIWNRFSAIPESRGPLVRGPLTTDSTRIIFGYDRNGVLNSVQDHLGTWTSQDGGTTWRIGTVDSESGPYRVRRGTPTIENGNYVFRDRDYGVQTTMSPDQTTTRSITTTTGLHFSVTRDAQNEIVSYRDRHGEWRRPESPNGERNTWTNTTTGEVRREHVDLTTYGEFVRFSAFNERRERIGILEAGQTAELGRIEALRERIIESHPGITFARPGETRVDDGVTYRNGMPTVAELEMLMSVLNRNRHVNYRAPENNVRVWFTAEATASDGSPADHWGQYMNNGHRCAGNCHERGGNLVITPLARLVTEGMQGLEGLLLHELAHHEQGLFYGHSNLAWGVGNHIRPDVLLQMREQGYVRSDLHTSLTENRRTTHHPGRPLLVDRHGQFWTSNGNQTWTRVVGELRDGRVVRGQLVGGRRDGGRLEGNGRLVGARVLSNIPNQTINDAQMRERALIPRATNYFPSPDEGQAEAFSMYRINANNQGNNRRTLFEQNPHLYRVIQAQDQRNIDRGLGTGPNGESLFIRGTDGVVVERSREIIAAIAREEARWTTLSAHEVRHDTALRQRRAQRQR